MIKLLDLGPKEFSYGVTTADHLDGPIFNSSTSGVGSLYEDSTKRGLLMAGPDANNVGSTAVVDTIIAGAINSSDDFTTMYSLGGSGHLYSQSMATPTTTPTDNRSATPITNPANGLEVFQAVGGARYLYYWQKTQIGRWNMTQAYPAGWTDNWAIGLDDTWVHPTHTFQDRIYYGNGAKVGYIYDNAGTPTNVLNGLDVPADYYVSSITDDGVYLVVGLTRQTGSGIFHQASGGKIVFWDTTSASWYREWNLPDSTGIISVKNVDGIIHVLETKRLSVCNRDTPPEQVVQMEGNLRAPMGGYGASTSDHQRMLRYKKGVLWITAGNTLAYYGKLYPDAPKSLHVPFGALTSPTVLLPIGVTSYIHVGGQSKYYAQATAGGGTSGSIVTRYFDLKDTYKIGRIELYFGDKLASGDTVSVDLAAEPTTGNISFGVASYANYGAVRKITLNGTHELESLQMTLTWSAGAIKIKRIVVWGDKVTT